MPDILALLAGKPKPKGDDATADSAPGGGAEREYAREAFSALQDDDEEGFVDAFLAAVRACSKKHKAGEYETDHDEF